MKKIAVLLENNFEESELLYPYHRLREDYDVVLVGTEADKGYVGKSGGLKVKSDISSSDAKASEFEGIYISGGFSPGGMRQCQATVDFVKEAHEASKR